MDENRYRVLLLEGEPIIGRATSRALAIEGFEVDIAVNGLSAKDKIDANKEYEFLIFDIRTPAMNDIQLYEYLEQDHPELTNRVIFITGDSLGVVTKKFLERVNRPFLSKPYTPTQLRDLIREVFSISAPYP
jgi:DNA-binding NtrC family response regulator